MPICNRYVIEIGKLYLEFDTTVRKNPCEANEIKGSRGFDVFHEQRTKQETINN